MKVYKISAITLRIKKMERSCRFYSQIPGFRLVYGGSFDDIFSKFTTNYELKKVKTTDLGSLFELVYSVTVNRKMNQKEFIDELRCRNGNLNITLSMAADSEY